MDVSRLVLAPLILAISVAQGPSDGYLVKLDVTVGSEEHSEPSALTIATEAGSPIHFRLSVFDPEHPDLPIDVEDSTWLLEVRRAAGGGAKLRFADMEHVAPGVYETSHTFEEPGLWTAVVQPDVEDRSTLPEGSTNEVTFRVTAEPTAVGGPPRPMAIVASIVLVLLVGALVVLAGRSRTRAPGEPPPEPVAHDTWWNSP